MFGDALQGFPGQVEPVKFRVSRLIMGHNAQCLAIMIKPAKGFHHLRQGLLAGMTERRMPQIVGQSQRFRQIFVKPQCTRDGTGDLGHFQAVCQPGPVMVPLVIDEHLCLMLEAAKGGGMDDPVPVPLIDGPVGAFLLILKASPAPGRIAGIGSA